ncbi:hypothetical protein ACH5RR_006779 [Cinchona calisaya]|uniref:Uncharacterized protein n=1 Tax=Cinchona calisaya TaxID=153742 RepID=A0ABD3APY5_9GENT
MAGGVGIEALRPSKKTPSPGIQQIYRGMVESKEKSLGFNSNSMGSLRLVGSGVLMKDEISNLPESNPSICAYGLKMMKKVEAFWKGKVRISSSVNSLKF